MARKRRPRSCRPCKPCKPCKKRRGSPRFTATCKAQFRNCMRSTLKETGSMKVAGKKCMTQLQRCSDGRSARRAVRRYKRMRAA